MKKSVLLVTTVLLLAGCSGKDVSPSESAKADYDKARTLLDNGHYDQANLFLGDFAAKHPYSQYAVQAELLRTFAAYKAGEYILSETLSQSFAENHPNHPDVPYAKYLLAMSHFKQVNKAERDQAPTRRAIEAFERLIREHPKTSYARDAAPRLQGLYNRLAKHEMHIGHYYFNKKQFVASVGRFQTVVEKYQTTPSIEEALYYLAASYAALNIHQSARETAILLRHNYPGSEWSAKAEAFL